MCGMKLCRICDTEKPLEDFPVSRKMKDGRHHRCRSCTSDYNAEYAARQKKNPPVIPVEKRCPACGETKPSSAFHKNARRPDGLLFYCKACWSARGRREKYGLSPEDIQVMLVQQDGVCAICGTEFTGRTGFHVDHDHADGRVRGLLCTNCNTGLGRFQDDPARLRAAIDYLARF